MKIIKLSCFGIVINIEGEEEAVRGAISSDLHDDGPEGEDNTLYYAALDGIESMILAHAMAGIDVECPAYIEGIETAVEAAANNL